MYSRRVRTVRPAPGCDCFRARKRPHTHRHTLTHSPPGHTHTQTAPPTHTHKGTQAYRHSHTNRNKHTREHTHSRPSLLGVFFMIIIILTVTDALPSFLLLQRLKVDRAPPSLRSAMAPRSLLAQRACVRDSPCPEKWGNRVPNPLVRPHLASSCV